jgi:hypothetical protein
MIWHDLYMSTLSNDQIDRIPKWLKGHQFKPDKSHTRSPDVRTWARGCCKVRIRKDENGDSVAEIRGGNCQWTELGHVLAQQHKDLERLVSSPMEIAVSELLGVSVSKMTSRGERLYSIFSPRAYVAKVFLQMLIGLGAVISLCWVLFASVGGHYHGQDLYTQAAHMSILVITAGLAAAAAVELAYTLFTPGPDEALDPLMLGLSAGILLLVTRDHIRVGWQYLGIIVGVIALGGLFQIRRRFLDS